MEPTIRPGNLPSASAVSINIFEPKAYAGAPAVPQQAPYAPVPQPQVYNYPQAPMYNYPQASMYNYPQAPMYNPQAQYSQPQYYPPLALVPPAAAPVPPAAVDQQPVPQAIPAAPTPEAAPVAPAPEVAPVAQPAAPAPETVQPSQPQAVDVNAINTGLKSVNLDDQTVAIQKIAEVGQSDPKQAAALLNEDTFKGLTEVIVKDTSNLQGPDKEKAETNKMIGMWTLAVLQKNFRETIEADPDAQKQGVKVGIGDLPGIAQVKHNLESDPNPVIREAAISALTYAAKPEDGPVILEILNIAATKDADANVKAAAQQAISNMQLPQQAANEQAQAMTNPAEQPAAPVVEAAAQPEQIQKAA